jgi:hypothetical protein
LSMYLIWTREDFRLRLLKSKIWQIFFESHATQRASERVKYNASLIAEKSSKFDGIVYMIIKRLYAKIQISFVINFALLRILSRNMAFLMRIFIISTKLGL